MGAIRQQEVKHLLKHCINTKIILLSRKWRQTTVSSLLGQSEPMAHDRQYAELILSYIGEEHK